MVEELLVSQITSLITGLGFPIAMTVWFMIRTEKVIGNNTEMMQKNTEAMGQMVAVIQNCTRK